MKQQDVEKRIPLLRSILTSLQECWIGIHPVRLRIELLKKGNKTPKELTEIELLEGQCRSEVERMNSYIKEVEDLGGQVVKFGVATAAFIIEVNGQGRTATWNVKDGLRLENKEVFA